MIARIKRWIAPPLFEDAEQTRLAGILNTLLLVTFPTSILFGAFMLSTSRIPATTLAIFCSILGAALAARWLLYRGRIRPAGLLYAMAMWAVLTYSAAGSQGVTSSPPMDIYLILVVSAGLFMGARAGLLFAGLGFFSALGLYLAVESGILPPPVAPVTPERSLVFRALSLAMAGVLVHVATNNIQSALRRARSHEQELTEKNRELEAIRSSLEQRIELRTAEITQQKRFYEALVKNSPIAIVTLDQGQRIVACNPAFEALFGYPESEAIGQALDDLITSELVRAEAVYYTEQVEQGKTVHCTGQRRRKDGRTVEVEIFGVPVLVEGKQLGVLGLYTDIGERKLAEQALRMAKEHAEQLNRVVPSAIFTVDPQGKITSLNAKAVELTGYSSREVIGRPCQVFNSGRCLKGCGLFNERVPKPVTSAECVIVTKSGERRTVIKNAELLRDAQGNILGGIESFEDITERKRAEEYLQYLATHDSLTGLPNRALFYERLNHALRVARRKQSQVVVMFMDLDGFKQVNDTFGHEQGDLLLGQVANRLSEQVRETDLVARLSGDEFAFVFEDMEKPEFAALVARKILEAMSRPFVVVENEIKISASLGVSRGPADGEEAEQLLKNADAAMYRAKELGKNTYQFFSGAGNGAQ